MELIKVKKGELTGFYVRHNIADFYERVDIPVGYYFQNGMQLIVALKVGHSKKFLVSDYTPSSKHSYLSWKNKKK